MPRRWPRLANVPVGLAYTVSALLAALVGVLLMQRQFGRVYTHPFEPNPQLPISNHNETSEEMQAVCNAQGHLQLLAKYPSDPRTAFELLNLDPSTRPFFPPKNSRWEQDEWHQELLETVDRRYTRLMELSSQSDGRGGDEHLKQYKLALTAASDLLFKDGPGRFYVDTVLPVLARVVHGQLPRCVWPRLRQFHRDLCAATWPSTGMLGVLRDSLRIGAADSGCFDSADASRWIGLLRLE